MPTTSLKRAYWRNTGSGAYRYGGIYEGAIYEAVPRKKDRVYTWRLIATFGPTRTGKGGPSGRFADELRELAAQNGYEWGFARHGHPVHDHRLNGIEVAAFKAKFAQAHRE